MLYFTFCHCWINVVLCRHKGSNRFLYVWKRGSF